MKVLFSRLLVIGFLTAGCCWRLKAQEPPSAAAGKQALPSLTEMFGMRIYNLKEFGSTSNAADTVATYKKALQELTGKDGGIVLVPEDVPADANLENVARWSRSLKPESNDLRDWKIGPGVTVFDLRGGNFRIRVPQLTQGHSGGVILDRVMRLPDGDSLQHWTEEGILSIHNKVIHGPCNYLDWIVEPVQAGPDARFYVPQIRNIFPGMYLNAHQGPGYGGKVERITVKSVGFDPEKKQHYFIAHTNIDHVAGAIVQNKSHVPAIRIDSHLNAANQTWDLKAYRHHYANGDGEIFHGEYKYMGNVHSMAGDENGGVFVGHTRSLTNIFRGNVSSIDNEKNELVFKNGSNAFTLGNSRPLINLNPDKWLTGGKVMVVPAESYWDTDDTGKYPYQGRTYPSSVYKVRGSGVSGLRMGGLIRGDRDCPWDESIIGRFFAIDEPSEYVPAPQEKKPVRRWYEITGLQVNADGTKDLLIRRYWWGAKDAGSPTLYNSDNYTYDGHERPLQYIIAPGAYVNDLSRAVGHLQHQHTAGIPPYTLGITPGPHSGTATDFAADDEIEQAIGPDPFKPQLVRGWAFDNVPGAWPASMIDLANHGPTARHSAMVIQGGPMTIEDAAKRQENRPAWDHGIRLASAATIGIAFEADTAKAAILFKQPNHEQAIKWQHGSRERGRPPAEASLTVSNQTGQFVFDNEAGIRARGISGDETPARNLRGKNVQVPPGARSLEVTFLVPEADADYAVFIEQAWLGSRAVSRKTAQGFTVEFGEPAPAGAALDWMLVR